MAEQASAEQNIKSFMHLPRSGVTGSHGRSTLAFGEPSTSISTGFPRMGIVSKGAMKGTMGDRGWDFNCGGRKRPVQMGLDRKGINNKWMVGKSIRKPSFICT